MLEGDEWNIFSWNVNGSANVNEQFDRPAMALVGMAQMVQFLKIDLDRIEVILTCFQQKKNL